MDLIVSIQTQEIEYKFGNKVPSTVTWIQERKF